MRHERKSPAAPILLMLVIGMLPLVAYLGGYFWAGQKISSLNPQVRFYRYRWQAAIFFPAAKVESYLGGSETVVESTENLREIFRLPPE